MLHDSRLTSRHKCPVQQGQDAFTKAQVTEDPGNSSHGTWTKAFHIADSKQECLAEEISILLGPGIHSEDCIMVDSNDGKTGHRSRGQRKENKPRRTTLFGSTEYFC